MPGQASRQHCEVTPREEGYFMEDSNESAEICPDCQALVADLEAHKRWHSRLVADLAGAVEKEIKRSGSPIG